MVLGKFPVPGRPAVWITVGQGPAALVMSAGGDVWTFLLSTILFSTLSPSLWETARYRLKYCLKGPFNPKQPANILERGWSGGAMVLGKLPVPGRPTIWITVGQGPTALAVGAVGDCLDIFTLVYSFSPLSPSLWVTARYRLK